MGRYAVIHKDGTDMANPTSDEFMLSKNKWYEVKSLIEDKVFIQNPTAKLQIEIILNCGDWVNVTKKFYTEYTPEGYFSLTFGSGNVDPMTNLDNYMTRNLRVNLATFLNNTSLGEIPKSNTTLFVKYRVGGGKETNIGVNVLTVMDTYELIVNGPNSSINTQVSQSIRVTNITPPLVGQTFPQ